MATTGGCGRAGRVCGRPEGARIAATLLVTAVLAACGAAPDGPAAAVGDPPPTPVAMPALGTSADELPVARLVLVRPDGREVPVTVRVADTAGARSRGLMGVTELPPGTGMLFRFPDLAAHGGFWMRGTLVPLDIAFLARGEVVAVATMTPCAADPCPVTRPDGAYDGALEIPAGWLAAEGIGPGARLRVVGE